MVEENRKSNEKYEEILAEMSVKLENQIKIGDLEKKTVIKIKILIQFLQLESEISLLKNEKIAMNEEMTAVIFCYFKYLIKKFKD